MDIKERNICWPSEEELKDFMTAEAQELINRMIQIDPVNRLGHNLKSIELLKTHPFFKGIDFEEVSKKKYKGVY